ncbi:hypothetical protein [Zwartia vadi]|uniref:hypothetical protein n=1 Tax=Zwartia vadi TaxID=3058168 RepID=UPI0025B5DB79|nr:hypothetical protein [Zwartia vadi]MDN3988801.1 hypothetical protein [Zwartia vadi]
MNQRIELISRDIKNNTTLKAHTTYVIDAEIHVKSGVTLTIEDRTILLITNGLKPKSRLRRSCLIFDQGSTLSAKRLYVKAASDKHKPVKQSDNGGIWFLGNFQDATKDSISVVENRKKPLSSFNAEMIATYYLGRHDPLSETKKQKAIAARDDIDGFSILGVGKKEWNVRTVRTFYSGDDGLDITNSHISFDRIEIKNPMEDALNFSSSRVEVHKSLIIDATKDQRADRDIFDFEVDDGSTFMEIYQHCSINICGCFGDEVVLSSIDLPHPNPNPDARYAFKGKSKNRSTLVYSIRRD